MRKLYMAAAALIILFTATTQMYAASGLTFTADPAGTVTRGETVTVPINVSNNQGFTAVGLVLSYDPDVLEITGVTAPVAAMPLNTQFALTSSPGTQWIHLVNTNLVDWYGNGTVANVTFRVKTNAALNTSSLRLSFTSTPNGAPTNSSGVLLTSADTVSGRMSVADPDGGGFIGTPYPEENPYPGTAIPDTSKPVDAGGPGFGKVPQTGVPDIAGLVTAVYVSLIMAAALCAYVLKRRTVNEKE